MEKADSCLVHLMFDSFNSNENQRSGDLKLNLSIKTA